MALSGMKESNHILTRLIKERYFRKAGISSKQYYIFSQIYPMLKEFKSYVDNAHSPVKGMTMEQAQAFLSYVPKQDYSFSNHLYELIRSEIETTEKENVMLRSKFLGLREDLINRHILLGNDYKEYFQVLKVINDSCRTADTSLVSIENESKWRQAIEMAKTYNEFFNTFKDDHYEMTISYKEEFDRAHSIKLLRDYGCEITVTDEDIEIKPDKILKDIDNEIKHIGGFTVANFLLKILENAGKYSSMFDRFLIHRETNMGTKVNPQVPFGYLLNLCAKYPHSNTPVSEKQIKDTIQKAIVVCNASYAVQHYSIWHYMNNSGETAIEMLRELVLWDTIFSIPQARVEYQINLCEFIFSKIDQDIFKQHFKVELSDYLTIAREVFKPTKNRPYRFTLTSLQQSTGLPTAVIAEVLKQMTHQSQVNKEYIDPGEGTKTDYFLKPLLKDGEQYIVLWRSWSGLALFEMFVAPLRKKVKNIDSDIGILLEKFLLHQLQRKGISYKMGKYTLAGVDGEADLIIETEEKIVLIEIKKKVLTRKAKSGHDVSLIIDLSETIIDATMQSSRTELLLRNHETITLLREDNTTETLSLSGRSFEHVSLAQMEFGGLHDKAIMQNLYMALLRYVFNVVDQTDTKSVAKFAELREKQTEFVNQYNKLMEHEAMPKHNPYFDNWFLSYNQLLEVIEMSSDNESFYRNLVTHKFVATGSFDFYMEFQTAKSMSENEQNQKLHDVMKNSNATYIPLSNPYE